MDAKPAGVCVDYDLIFCVEPEESDGHGFGIT